jgi:hypothetical protein
MAKDTTADRKVKECFIGTSGQLFYMYASTLDLAG